MLHLLCACFLATTPAIPSGPSDQKALTTALEPSNMDDSPAFAYAKQKLPHEGTLQQTESGLLYLKVSDRYIYELLPLLPGSLAPPPYFGPGLIGAHITLIAPSELQGKTPPKLPPLGTTYTFTLESLVCGEPAADKKAVSLCALHVLSPQLDQIRTDAGLPPRTLDIVIGMQTFDSSTPPLELTEYETPPPMKNRVVLVD